MSHVALLSIAPAPSRADMFDRGRIAGAFLRVARAWATRAALRELTDHELDDIGVSRAAALAEARRLPWDVSVAR